MLKFYVIVPIKMACSKKIFRICSDGKLLISNIIRILLRYLKVLAIGYVFLPSGWIHCYQKTLGYWKVIIS